MSDLISRSALMKEFEIQEFIKNDRLFDITQIKAFINEQPTVEPVRVIHCKDCDLLHTCRYAQHLGLDGYCSNAEKGGVI